VVKIALRSAGNTRKGGTESWHEGLNYMNVEGDFRIRRRTTSGVLMGDIRTTTQKIKQRTRDKKGEKAMFNKNCRWRENIRTHK